MNNCRICQNSVPQYQAFCPICGARQILDTTSGIARKSVFVRLKSSFEDFFRSEVDKEAERYRERGFDMGQYGFEAAVPYHEKAAKLNKSNKYILAITYAGAGNERLGMWGGGGPINELRLWTEGKAKAKEILSWVSKLRELEGKVEFLQYHEAYEGLNTVLNGSLEMYDNSIRVDSNYAGGYSERARAFHKVADGILWAYGITPICSLTHTVNEPKGKIVQYGNVILGICLKQEMPELVLVTEILWFYKEAEEGFHKALQRDPTDAELYVELSYVQRHLDKGNEAVNNLSKALTILNRAIHADKADEKSYSERAKIFEEFGEIDLAIADLERALTLLTWEFKIDSIKQKIAELRKRKGVTS